MRRISTLVLFVFAFTISLHAQKHMKRINAKLSSEQRATLAVKKMTLALDLNESQQNKLLPLFKNQINFRKEIAQTKASFRSNDKKPSSDDLFALQNKQLDQRISFRNALKNILSENQFNKFQKMSKMKMRRGKKRIQMAERTKRGRGFKQRGK
ncbi:MAG: hypothetical protein HWD82_09550 [Flavobacteriaceae bacterium]|nr:hypothetical protein [Flavobacteriaceae bacterium]